MNFAVVFPELDRASHILWEDKEKLFNHYFSIDKAIGKLIPYLKNFVICSDHGFIDWKTSYEKGWTRFSGEKRKGDHSPNAIGISDLNIPETISELGKFILNRVSPK